MAENVNPVVLEVSDYESREVHKVSYKFEQETDKEGQLIGIPRGGRVTVRVKAMNDGNNQLLQWALDPTGPKDFEIKFLNTIDGTSMKSLKGTGCYCVHYVERWEDKMLHYEEIEIVCQKLENGPVSFDNPWK